MFVSWARWLRWVRSCRTSYIWYYIYIYNLFIYIYIFWIIRIYREPFREPFLLGMVRSCAEASLIPLDICIFGEIDFRAAIFWSDRSIRSGIKLWAGHGWTPKQPWIKRAVSTVSTYNRAVFRHHTIHTYPHRLGLCSCNHDCIAIQNMAWHSWRGKSMEIHQVQTAKQRQPNKCRQGASCGSTTGCLMPQRRNAPKNGVISWFV